MSLLVPPRVPSDEILDGSVPPAAAEESLADIEWIHRRLGGRFLVRRHVLPLLAAVPSRTPSLLDVGAGTGHVGRDLAARLRRRGRTLRVIDLDRQATHAALARPRSAAVGDAFRIPLGDRSVDVVCSTLFCHHFSPEELRLLLAEQARVARHHVVALDLARHRVSLVVARLLGRLAFRSPVSRHDARASVLQAYTRAEASGIASGALPGSTVLPAGPLGWKLLWTRP